MNIARFLSALTIPLLILMICVYNIVVLPKIRDENGKLVSQKFDKTKKPVWIGHITDLHIAPYLEDAQNNLRDAFEAFNIIDPSNILITGDIVNTYTYPEYHCRTDPAPEHFEAYRKIRDDVVKNKTKLFEIIGNHDAWGTIKWDDLIGKDIFPVDPSKYAGTRVVDGVRIVMYNPIVTPVSTGDLMSFWLSPFPETLEALENELGKETSAEVTLVATHQTTEMFVPDMRSRNTNRTLLEILEDPKYRVIGFINGHTHPVTPQFRRYKNFVECTQVCLKHNRIFGVVTIDNGRLSYTSLPLDTKDDYAILTYPIPDNIALNTYQKDDFQVRLISFSDKPKNFIVDGSVKGVMKRGMQLNSNAWLYTLDANIENGHHSIHITGDTNISLNFTIGTEIEGRWHVRKKPFNIVSFVPTIIVNSILFLVMTVPALLPNSLFTKIDAINRWLRDGKGESHYISMVFLGPVLTARRLSQHQFLVIIFILALIGGFTLPVLFYQVGGVPSQVWIYGYRIGTTFHSDPMTRYYLVSSLVFLYIPLVIFASMTFFRFSLSTILVIAAYAYPIRKCFLDVWLYVYSVDPDNWLKSPMFVGFPLLMCIGIVAAVFTTKRDYHKKIE